MRDAPLACLLQDGQIEFLGREDTQVKIHGYRIELGEIEAALLGHPSVTQAAVAVRGSTQDGRSLIAYVVSADGDECLDRIRDDLGTELPPYMVPSVFHRLAALPLTTNGKVDRSALPEPTPPQARATRRRGAPSDEVETRLCLLFEEILNLPSEGVADDFFALGGNSFSAMRLAARIEKDFGVHVPLSAMFEGASVERLGELIRVGRPQQWATMVRLRGTGDSRPVFFVHPVGGNVLCYNDLARHLGDERPFYAAQSVGLAPNAKAQERIEDMAKHYLRSMYTLDPEDPYDLGGWSMGAIIAYEMARQVTSEGGRVGTLVVIDAKPPRVRDEMTQRDRLLAFATDILGGSASHERLLSRLRETPSDELEERLLIEISEADPAAQENATFQRLLSVFTANSRALESYRLGDRLDAVPCDLTVITAANAAESAPHGGRPWADLATAVRHVEMPGDHYSIMRPPLVTQLAEHVRESFGRYQNGG